MSVTQGVTWSVCSLAVDIILVKVCHCNGLTMVMSVRSTISASSAVESLKTHLVCLSLPRTHLIHVSLKTHLDLSVTGKTHLRSGACHSKLTWSVIPVARPNITWTCLFTPILTSRSMSVIQKLTCVCLSLKTHLVVSRSTQTTQPVELSGSLKTSSLQSVCHS